MLASVLCALATQATRLRAQEVIEQPVYVRGDSGWIGLMGHGAEYARFVVPGRDADLQDPNHVLLPRGVGLMLSFVAADDLSGRDLLRAHAQWEAEYWRAHAVKVDTATRPDLSGHRSDVRVTQLTVRNGAGQSMGMYVIGEQTADGVFVYALSPAERAGDALVRQFVHSITLVHRPLTPVEVKKVSVALKRVGRGSSSTP